jgi:organic hydroperoxide reductase OsmC/OhrA
MESERELTTTLEQVDDFVFTVKFEDTEDNTLLMDEPKPLGKGYGPNATQVLSAAIGNCLSASLLYCLRRARIEPTEIKTTVKTTLTRNEKGRLRIGAVRVSINPQFEEYALGDVGRCLELFEDYCVVTQSVRQGIDVQVELVPSIPVRV